MRKGKLLKASTAALSMMLLTSLLLSAQQPVPIHQEKKFYVMIEGAFSLVQEIGSDADYVAGENDFPITPSHSEFGGGLGFLINFSDNLALQITGDYLLGADVEKEDPSDGETFTYTTYDNINVLGSLIVKFGEKTKTQFFVSGGAGINLLMPYDDKEVEGSLGSIIVLEAPDTKSNLMAAFGGGVIFNMKKSFFKVEALYMMIFDTDKNSIMLRAGFGF